MPKDLKAAPADIPGLPYLDRYRNEGTRSYSPHAGYTEARRGYRPDSDVVAFDVAVFEVPVADMNVYRANPNPDLEAFYLGNDRVRFCIHPQLLEEHPDEAYVRRTRTLGTPRAPIPVAPSSSTRTLYVQGHPQAHALKLHFPFRVSRYGRRMRDEVVEQAIVVSEELEGWAGGQDDSFAFMREVLGVTHRNLDPHAARGEHWGYLVRDLIPFPVQERERRLVPGFALYGGDYFDPRKRPLLFDLIGRTDPAEWVLEAVMLPIVRHWISCFRALGYVLEPHGQNVLLEVAPDGSVPRIVHRDLSVGIDMRRRHDLGLSDNGLNQYNRLDSGVFASIAYDKFMGSHFFDALVALLMEVDPGLRPEDMRGPCRAEFAGAFPEHVRYLPRTVHYFAEERDRFGKPLHLDTGIPPVWRP